MAFIRFIINLWNYFWSCYSWVYFLIFYYLDCLLLQSNFLIIKKFISLGTGLNTIECSIILLVDDLVYGL